MRTGLKTRRIEGAAILGQVGTQNVGIPTRSGPELDHRHARFQTPEGQGLDRMAPAVAGLVLRGSPIARDGPGQTAHLVCGLRLIRRLVA